MYIYSNNVKEKHNIDLFEFSDKFCEDNLKSVGYVESYVFDNENGVQLIWDSNCVFDIPFPEKIGEIYERGGCVFKAVLAYVGWPQFVGAWKSMKRNLILISIKLDQRGMDCAFSCMQSSKEEFDNFIEKYFTAV